jgi:hypothetical protein
MNSIATIVLLALSLWLCLGQVASAGTRGAPPDDFAPLWSSSNEIRSLQYNYMTYECEAPFGPIWDNWSYDTSSPTGQVCYYNYISRCCGPLQEYTSCADSSFTVPWPGAFVNGVCTDYSADNCCYTEDGYTEWEFSSCYDSQEKILVNWNADATTCTSISLSNCCQTQQKYSSCSGSSKPFPGKWNGGVCLGYFESDCCFLEDHSTSYNFVACNDNQEMIEGQWSGGYCHASLLSQCCRSTDTTGNREAPKGASTSNSGDSLDGAAAVAIGIVIGVFVVAVMVAIVCLRHRSCPLYGKMKCTRKDKQQLASNQGANPATVEDEPIPVSNYPREAAPESTGTSEERVNKRIATIDSVIRLIERVLSLVTQILSR